MSTKVAMTIEATVPIGSLFTRAGMKRGADRLPRRLAQSGPIARHRPGGRMIRTKRLRVDG